MIRNRFLTFALVFCVTPSTWAQSESESKWRQVEIDRIEIGYGLAMADVNGDGKTDIVLADKKTVQWYENPSWEKHVIASDLTVRDNVCVAARDIDADGRCEIAVGGQWNYRESTKDGAIHYLFEMKDSAEPWSSVKLYNEPSTHRMHWIRSGKDTYQLAVKPLRGRGSKDGDGAGLKLLAYSRPENILDDWKHEVVCDFMHLSHNFHVVNWDDDIEEEMIIAGKEGVWYLDRSDDQWTSRQLTEAFAGEVRDGRLPGGGRFITTIQPMHGSTSAVFVQSQDADRKSAADSDGLWQLAKILDESLKDGHAIACADYLGLGCDQIIVGWRAMNDPGVPGIKLFTPLDSQGNRWREEQLSGKEIAVEDIKAADLNGDGKPDFVAAARQTKNLVIFFNEN